MNMNMNMNMNKSLWVKLAISFVLLMSLVLSSTELIDQSGKKAIDQSLKTAFTAFATARVVNAGISIFQGTQVSVTPFGLGMTFAPGEVLDPVNDLIERFSWVMFASTSSIAIQKVFMDMLTTGGFVTFFQLMFLLTLAVTWLPKSPPRVKCFLVKVSIVLVFLRFTVPILFTLNGAVYDNFLGETIKTASANIKLLDEKVKQVHNNLLSFDEEKLSSPSIPNQEKEKPDQPKVDKRNEKVEQEKSYVEMAKELRQKGFAALQSTGREVKEAIQKIPEVVKEIPEAVKRMGNYSITDGIQNKIEVLKESVVEIGDGYVKQITNYVAVFILNTVMFPIVFLYGFYRLGKYLMTINLMPLFNE